MRMASVACSLGEKALSYVTAMVPVHLCERTPSCDHLREVLRATALAAQDDVEIAVWKIAGRLSHLIVPERGRIGKRDPRRDVERSCYARGRDSGNDSS